MDQPSSETFWNSAEDAEMWVNYLYNSLPDFESVLREDWSDNGFHQSISIIAAGRHTPSTNYVEREWDYETIRRCLELFQNIEKIPNISQERKNELMGQARFILVFTYFEMMTLFRDIPLVKEPLPIEESDIPKSPKQEVLTYILEQIDMAINELPVSLTASQSGKITKGAALALKARMLLYNERWEEAAAAAKQLMDLNVYELHPDFGELFISETDNKTNEIILAYQYVKTVKEHQLIRRLHAIGNGGFSQVTATPSLANAFECIDGLPIDESPLYDPENPFENRDTRFYETFIFPYQTINGFYYDPLDPANWLSLTFLHFRKYINDIEKGKITGDSNWILIRYAEVLLTYAEAKNEASGPENSIYDALDLVRLRAGMPVVDRDKYNTKEKLRMLIRNERRVELSVEGGGLRYFDIIRWRIAEEVLNTIVTSFEVPGKLPKNNLDTWVFDPNKHYVWPIPQSAIDKAKNLEQHPEWQ